MRLSAKDRFWEKVQIPQTNDGCWNWLGGKSQYGYARFSLRKRPVEAHRFSFELLSGRIPRGLTLDHLCRNIICVRPDHLEPVTARENTLRGFGIGACNARKTHCKRGHLFSPENMFHTKRGRRCKVCDLSLRAAQRRLAGIPIGRWPQ